MKAAAAGTFAVILVLSRASREVLTLRGLAADVLPDLGVAPIREVVLSAGSGGSRKLHFTTSIANVGRGPLEVVSTRRTLEGAWIVSQRIRRSDRSAFNVKTSARLAFNGSADHGHWHIRRLAQYELRRLSDLEILRVRVKRGFCLYDSRSYRPTLRGAAPRSRYSRLDCGTRLSLRTTTGVSVGWMDDYCWRTEGQDLDITGLPAGKYRLYNRVDPSNWFKESNEGNNTTWVDLLISATSVTVTGRSRPV